MTSYTSDTTSRYNHQWPKLVRVLEDGRLPLDTNEVENAIRPFVLGGKVWLFADTAAGADASANLHSLAETAKPNGIEPFAYLRCVFERISAAERLQHFEALLPDRTDRAALLCDR